MFIYLKNKCLTYNNTISLFAIQLLDIAAVSSNLMFLEKRIITNSECRRTFGKIITEDMICAQDPTGGYHDACAVSTKFSRITFLSTWSCYNNHQTRNNK